MPYFVSFLEVNDMAQNLEKRNRTKQKLADALVELCEEKNYYDITVWDICNKAQLYRSTFYRYYETKDDMLREIELEYVEETQKLTKSLGDFRSDASEEKMQFFLKELTDDMEDHRSNARLCRFLLSPAGDIYFHQKMVESLGKTVRQQIQKSGKHRPARETHYLVTYFASGFVSTIHEWLIRDDCTPGEMAAFLLEMIKRFET